MTTPKTLWVVDDEPEICDLLKLLLSEAGYIVTSFPHPVAALDALPHSAPEMIVSDFKMPEMNGLDFFLEIRNHWSGKFIMLTGEPTANPVELKSLGIKEVLFKPRDLTRILTVIQDISKNK